MKKIDLFVPAICIALLTACAAEDIPQEPVVTALPETTVTTVAPEPEISMEEKLLAEMSLEEKVGQMFFVRSPLSEQECVEKIYEYHFGGYILFAQDFKDASPEEAKAKISACQSASKIPMLIGVDEEGGTVNRISKYKQHREGKFKSPQELFADGGMEAVYRDSLEKADFLKSYGVNVNLAPVADISLSDKDYIYDRTFGQNAEATAEYVRTVISAYGEKDFSGVLKHFPGYGANADTHKGFTVDERSLESFRESDFLPFKAGIEAGAEAVLVNHNIITAMNGTLPASLAPEVHELLRNELGFDGVIMTDDLMMDAIAKADFGENYAILAVKAGNDLLINSSFEEGYKAVLEAVQSGEIHEERIDESVLRILRWKAEMGLLD